MSVFRVFVVAVILFANPAFAGSEPDSPQSIGAEDLEYLRAIMKETWHCLDSHVSLVSGLPYDSSEGKDITNTNKETAYNAPRVYAFDSKLLSATNALAVRVSDWQGNGGIWRGPVAIGPEAELREVMTTGK